MKMKTNIMLIILIVTILFCSGVTVYAASKNPTGGIAFNNYGELSDSEFETILESYNASKESYAYKNWSTTHEIYGIADNWAKQNILDLIERKVIRGVKHNNKIYIPAENYINGKDALGIALFYYWGSDYNGDADKRKSTYANGATYMANKVRDGGYNFRKVYNSSSMTRKEAALILAGCIQAASDNRIQLSDYHTSALGRDSDGNVISGYSSKNYTDYDEALEILKQDPQYMQAINMLIDCGVCNGRADKNGTNDLAPNGIIQYNEYYAWLAQVSVYYPPVKVEDSYSLTADLSMSATSATLNYKDFLEKSARGGYATLKATLDASKSVAKKNNSVIDIENYDYTISETKPNNVKGKDYNTGKMSNTVKFPKEYTYWVDTILANDITSSTDKTKSKDQVELTLRNDKNKGDYTYDITYNGSVTVYATLGDDGLQSKTATATTTGQVILENKAPVVDCEIYSTADVDEAYKRDFFYVGTPIKIKDYCWDKEDETPQTIEYLIEYYKNRDLTTVIESKNFDIEMKNAQYVSGVVADDDERYHKMTFKKSGYYKITITAIDEMRKQRMETFTIYVSGTPQPPIAKLIGPDYGYMNTNITFTDASTDPNDDIIKWEWPNVMNTEGKEVEYVEWFDEVLDEFDEGTGEGEWVIAKEDTDYEIVSIHAPHPVS